MLEETYLKIISAKTAELFAASTKVGAILSNVKTKEKEALEFYGRNLGLTFQIADDTLDYNSELKWFDGVWSRFKPGLGKDKRGKSGVERNILNKVGEKIFQIPNDFNAHKTLKRVFEFKSKRMLLSPKL